MRDAAGGRDYVRLPSFCARCPEADSMRAVDGTARAVDGTASFGVGEPTRATTVGLCKTLQHLRRWCRQCGRASRSSRRASRERGIGRRGHGSSSHSSSAQSPRSSSSCGRRCPRRSRPNRRLNDRSAGQSRIAFPATHARASDVCDHNSTGAELAVLPRQVGQSADGWVAADRGVGPVVIVGVQPGRECVTAG